MGSGRRGRLRALIGRHCEEELRSESRTAEELSPGPATRRQASCEWQCIRWQTHVSTERWGICSPNSMPRRCRIRAPHQSSSTASSSAAPTGTRPTLLSAQLRSSEVGENDPSATDRDGPSPVIPTTTRAFQNPLREVTLRVRTHPKQRNSRIAAFSLCTHQSGGSRFVGCSEVIWSYWLYCCPCETGSSGTTAGPIWR